MPVLAYLAVRQIAGPTLAIGTGFAVALAVFAINRRAHHGVVQWFAVFSLTMVAIGAVAGIALGSDKAFLANDIVGDYLTAAILIGSLLIGRPLAGAMAREMCPRIRGLLVREHPVFITITLMYVASNLAMGTYRLLLIQAVPADEYVIFSRAASWPLGIGMFALSGWLLRRAATGKVGWGFPRLSLASLPGWPRIVAIEGRGVEMHAERRQEWPPAPYGAPRWDPGSSAPSSTEGDGPGDPAPREDRRPPWYGRLSVVAAAFVIFPPLGLYLAWRHQRLFQRPLWVRLTAVSVTVLWVLLSVAPRPDGGGQAVGSAPLITGQVEEVRQADETAPPAATEGEPPAPAQEVNARL